MGARRIDTDELFVNLQIRLSRMKNIVFHYIVILSFGAHFIVILSFKNDVFFFFLNNNIHKSHNIITVYKRSLTSIDDFITPIHDSCTHNTRFKSKPSGLM